MSKLKAKLEEQKRQSSDLSNAQEQARSDADTQTLVDITHAALDRWDYNWDLTVSIGNDVWSISQTAQAIQQTETPETPTVAPESTPETPGVRAIQVNHRQKHQKKIVL